MSHETVYYSRPRTYGKGSRGCRVTGDKKKSGVIRKYGLNMSRQAFREQADAIGFKKVSGDGTCAFDRSYSSADGCATRQYR
ncbi:40S ribosomal protein S29 [Diplodia seriata]|uniref:40S ribosomal protein S29 n=1 Tax=Diplodia seriata TaxID=420778 RepID=A0A1S8B3U5_9PEZI|nr:40S ribosomal protein S29 [Diplodia seriata]